MWVAEAGSVESLVEATFEERSPSSGSPGWFGVGVHLSGFAVWASRVSKGKKLTFGRPEERQSVQRHRYVR